MIIIKEENYYGKNEYVRYFYNPYLNVRIDCARCGKTMKMSDLFLVDTKALDEDDLYRPIEEVNPSDYDEEYRNRYILGMVPVVSEESDDEGNYSRCFCKSCWNKIWNMNDEDIFNNFEVSYME